MTIHTRAQQDADAAFAATLTDCAGTWLETPPQPDEIARIKAARGALDGKRREVHLPTDHTERTALALGVFRERHFVPLHFSDSTIEKVIAQHGEPPVVIEQDDPAFTNYLRTAIGSLASARVRRVLVDQAARLLPIYVEAGQYREALAIEYALYRTRMSDDATPLLVQMLLGGLVRWYEERDLVDDVA